MALVSHLSEAFTVNQLTINKINVNSVTANKHSSVILQTETYINIFENK